VASLIDPGRPHPNLSPKPVETGVLPDALWGEGRDSGAVPFSLGEKVARSAG
jgi:hypothetical protein